MSIGRIREDKVYDFKFIGLSHNTVRGAAGGAILCAEPWWQRSISSKMISPAELGLAKIE